MNKKILAPLFVAASFLIVGCSSKDIIGRPSWIDQDIVFDVDGDLKNNKMKEIYDAIKELGDTNSTVLNKVMYKICQKQFGTFEELKKFSKDGNADEKEFRKFVDGHDAYKPDAKSAVKEGAEIVIKDVSKLTQDQKDHISLDKIKQQYSTIVERICETLYNEVKGGSYTKDTLRKTFSEEEFVRHLKKELYAPVLPDSSAFYNGKTVFTAKPTGMSWREFVNKNSTDTGYLHIFSDTDDELTEIYYPKTAGEDGGYIGRKILPDIYRELLVERYVRDQRYTNLGRAYARKVNMIKITGDSNNKDKIWTMLKYFAETHITGNTNTPATYGDIEDLNKAMIGIANEDFPNVAGYLDAGTFNKIQILNKEATPKYVDLLWELSVDKDGKKVDVGKTTPVYYGTKLGDIVEKYNKIFEFEYVTPTATHPANFDISLKLPLTEEAKTAYEEFTNKDAYPIEVGVELKEREILSTDLTQDGWFLKNGGLTDLSEDFRKDLFNITASNIVDDEEKMKVDDKGWGEYEEGDTVRYFQTKNKEGENVVRPYLIGSNDDPSAPWKSVVLHETGDDYFIVQIDEAASLAKLSLDDKRSYLRLRATDKIYESNAAMNDIIQGITKQVASSDTYKKNAEQYYLMISNIIFYDDSVYEYFKSQFPDLFK